ncbi:MAG: TIGR01458 family HAD-type hydrolase [Gemmatimonadales bacterium]
MPDAYLFDLDGTLYTEVGAVPGAVDLVRSLRAREVPFRLVTNTTSRPRRTLVERLRGYGFEVEAREIATPVTAGAEIARSRGYRRIAPFVPEATLEDLEGFELIHEAAGQPEVVMVGDLGAHWDFGLMQKAFAFLMAGADLIAFSRDRYWMRGDGLILDAGPFVVGLEYASGKTATIAGKPAAEFFHAAVSSLRLPAGTATREVVMVGDDLWSDVEGAQQAGYQGWLVRTGKFRPDTLARSGVTPDRILGSVADLR